MKAKDLKAGDMFVYGTSSLIAVSRPNEDGCLWVTLKKDYLTEEERKANSYDPTAIHMIQINPNDMVFVLRNVEAPEKEQRENAYNIITSAIRGLLEVEEQFQQPNKPEEVSDVIQNALRLYNSIVKYNAKNHVKEMSPEQARKECV